MDVNITASCFIHLHHTNNFSCWKIVGRKKDRRFLVRERGCFLVSGFDRGKNVIYLRRKEIDPTFRDVYFPRSLRPVLLSWLIFVTFSWLLSGSVSSCFPNGYVYYLEKEYVVGSFLAIWFQAPHDVRSFSRCELRIGRKHQMFIFVLSERFGFDSIFQNGKPTWSDGPRCKIMWHFVVTSFSLM
jgi:hypothetical protein